MHFYVLTINFKGPNNNQLKIINKFNIKCQFIMFSDSIFFEKQLKQDKKSHQVDFSPIWINKTNISYRHRRIAVDHINIKKNSYFYPITTKTYCKYKN